MRKQLLFLLFLVQTCSVLVAQTSDKNTVRGFTSASGASLELSCAYGQVFFEESKNSDGVSVYPGIMQAQLVQVHVEDETCQNEGYDSLGFVFTPPVEPGTYFDTTYVRNAQYNYDSLSTLNLVVYPAFELLDTMKVDRSELASLFPGYLLHDGENDITWQTIHGCDSLVHYMIYTCGDTIADIDNNIYNSKWVGPYCWTIQNMRTEHYLDNSDVPNMIYKTPIYNDEAANLATYGRLYDWYAAVKLPDGSTSQPDTNEMGFVQGLCPEGWHIPTEDNFASLLPIGAPDLKSTERWVIPGTNGTKFTALPAGIYNAQTKRFENMTGETHFWSDSEFDTSKATNIQLKYNCDDVLMSNDLKYSGFSVRCVKNQKF